MPQTLRRDGTLVTISVNGAEPGHLGAPEVEDGRPLQGPGEAVVDTKTGADLGSTVSISGQRLRVVGEVENRTYLAGRPVVYLALSDAQRIAFDGRPLASAILITGSPAALPPGLVRLSNDEVEEDMLRPLEGATSAIDLLRVLMWIVAAVIIGAIIYLSALERLTDFAVLKASAGSPAHSPSASRYRPLIASLLGGPAGGPPRPVSATGLPAADHDLRPTPMSRWSRSRWSSGCSPAWRHCARCFESTPPWPSPEHDRAQHRRPDDRVQAGRLHPAPDSESERAGARRGAGPAARAERLRQDDPDVLHGGAPAARCGDHSRRRD